MSVTYAHESGPHPLDALEALAGQHEWKFERSDDSLTMLVAGEHADFNIDYTWMPDIEVLHLACGFDLRVPVHRRHTIRELIDRINERLWVGHFDAWFEEGTILFRYGTPLPEAKPDVAQCAILVSTALDTCNRHYPAFQFVVWAGKTAQEALDAIAMETRGSA